MLSLAAVHAVIGAGVTASETVSHSIFIARIGAEHLPTVLLARALLGPLMAFIYARFASARPVSRTLGTLALGAAGFVAAAPTLIDAVSWGAMLTYVGHELLASLLTIHWGVYLLGVLQGRRRQVGRSPGLRRPTSGCSGGRRRRGRHGFLCECDYDLLSSVRRIRSSHRDCGSAQGRHPQHGDQNSS